MSEDGYYSNSDSNEEENSDRDYEVSNRYTEISESTDRQSSLKMISEGFHGSNDVNDVDMPFISGERSSENLTSSMSSRTTVVDIGNEISKYQSYYQMLMSNDISMRKAASGREIAGLLALLFKGVL